MEILFVNLTEKELKQKIQDTVSNVACFTSRETAESCINEVIINNADAISTWLFEENTVTQRLKLSFEHQTYIGYGMLWRAEEIMKTSKSYVVLCKTEFVKHEEGFLIEFASPLLEKGMVTQ